MNIDDTTPTPSPDVGGDVKDPNNPDTYEEGDNNPNFNVQT